MARQRTAPLFEKKVRIIMHVPIMVLDSSDDVGRIAAKTIADGIEQAGREGRMFVLGCPSGRSPMPTYSHLAALVADRDLNLANVIIALMDEYVLPDGDDFTRVDPALPHSCVGFGQRDILGPLNGASRRGRRIPDDHLWYPEPSFEPGAYDARLAEAGGIDVFLLASGASDGHVALNPPGTDVDSVTRVVLLDNATRRDNLSTFPSFRDLDDVPTHGVTVGISTIRDLSRAVIMVVTGAHKKETVQRLASAEAYQPDWPATILSECASSQFFVDEEAAALLATP